MYLATNAQLSDLTFTLTGTMPGQAMRVLVGQKNQFFELKLASETANVIHPSFIIHSPGNLAAGATVQDRNGAAVKITFSHGLVSTTANTVTMRQTDEIAAATSPMKFQLASNNDLQVLSNGPTAQTNVTTRVIAASGAVTTAPARQLMIQKPN